MIDRSVFRCTVTRAESVGDAQTFVRELQQEYADATHNCWAYVIGAPGSTSHIGLSDDGEPHGTAGRPMLTVLLHSGIGEIAAVVTRWYGGTKLGTGGLARAYSGAVQQTLAELTTVQRVDTVDVQVIVEYGAVTPVRQLFALLDAEISDEQYAEHVTYEIKIARDCEAQLRTQLADLTRGQAIVHVSHGE